MNQAWKMQVKTLAKQWIPRRYHGFFQGNWIPSAAEIAERDQVRRDVVRYPIQTDVYLETYWKIFGLGQGPSLIFYAYGNEVLKFDCYAGKGHCHIQLVTQTPGCEDRLALREQTVEEQIERAIFEVTRNLTYWIQRHPSPKVNYLKVDRKKLQEAVQEAKVNLLTYHQKLLEIHPSFYD